MANSAIVKEEIEIKDEVSEDLTEQLINKNFPHNLSSTPSCPSNDIQNIITLNNAGGLLGLDNNIAGIFSTETVGSKTLVVFRRLLGPLPESLKPPRIISKCASNKLTDKIERCCSKCNTMMEPYSMGNCNSCRGAKSSDSKCDNDKYPRTTYGNKKIVLHCEKCNKDIEGDRYFYRKQCENCQTNLSFRCTICDELFTRHSRAAEHLNSTCGHQEMIQCSNCDAKVYTNSQLIQHHTVFHGDKPMIGSRQLKQHLLTCKKERTVQCAHCPYKGKFKGNIRNHLKTCRMEQPIYTNGNSISTSKDSQKETAQMKVHHFCFICNKRKLAPYRLKNCQRCNNAVHLWCTICDKAFAIDNPKACEHVKTSLDTYIHECERCARYFISVKKLMLHKVHHCNKKLIHYSCSYCTKKFYNESQLLRHEHRKHPKISNQPVLSTSKIGKSRQIDDFALSDLRTEKNHGKKRDLKRNASYTFRKEKKTTYFFSCQKCNANFVKKTDYSRHLKHCEAKLNMQCKVLLTRLKI